MPIPFESSIGSIPLTGIGTLSATNASALLSTLTVMSQGSGFPTTATVIRIKNSAGGGIWYFCPYGGTATSGNGYPIDAGTEVAFNLRNPSLATGISATTSTITVIW